MVKPAENINTKRKEDALELALLIYDIYMEEQDDDKIKHEQKGTSKFKSSNNGGVENEQTETSLSTL